MTQPLHLLNGHAIPAIGLGTWKIFLSHTELKELLRTALRLGCRLIDGAAICTNYGIKSLIL